MEALAWANKKLKDHQDIDFASGDRLDSPMLDCEVLLAAAIEQPKTYLFSHLDEIVPEQIIRKYKTMIRRRAKHEPVSYIRGYKEFYKRNFRVNKNTLIPRPDTEVLIDEAIALKNHNVVYLDIGTGSGAIAITLALETGQPIIATDISEGALRIAKQNAKALNTKDVTFLLGDLIEPITEYKFQVDRHVVFVANLPYLSSHQWNYAQNEVKDFQPQGALDGGYDGMDVYRRFFAELKSYRKLFPAQCSIIIEIDPDQTKLSENIITRLFPQARIKIKKDLAGLDRAIIIQI